MCSSSGRVPGVRRRLGRLGRHRAGTVRSDTAGDQTEQAWPATMIGNGTAKQKIATKEMLRRRVSVLRRVRLPDPDHRLGDDGDDRRPDPEEKPGNPGDGAIQRVCQGQGQHGDEAREDEQRPRDDPPGSRSSASRCRSRVAGPPGREGADSNSGRAGTGLRSPITPLDKLPVHDRDLPGRTAEAQRGNATPGPKSFSNRDARRGIGSFRCWRGIRHVIVASAFETPAVGERNPANRIGRLVRSQNPRAFEPGPQVKSTEAPTDRRLLDNRAPAGHIRWRSPGPAPSGAASGTRAGCEANSSLVVR